MPRPTTSTSIPPKPTKVHPAINNHIPVLKRIPPQLIQRGPKRFLSSAVPVAARFALELFEAIHSLDRERLARRLADGAQARGACPTLFVQVNTGREPQKAGVDPDGLEGFLAVCRGYDLPVFGLMAIPPMGADPGPHFELLRELAARHGLAGLSMGMSEDFEAAITDLRADHTKQESAER